MSSTLELDTHIHINVHATLQGLNLQSGLQAPELVGSEHTCELLYKSSGARGIPIANVLWATRLVHDVIFAFN